MTKIPPHFPDHITPEDEQDWDYQVCDSCGAKVAEDDIYHHEDGNLYCEDCNYETEQDRIDAIGDMLHDRFRDEGW